MTSTATVEAAATAANCATTVEVAASANRAAANYVRAAESVTAMYCDAAMIPSAGPAVAGMTPAVAWASAVETVEPRPCANEGSADKVLRAPIAVRRARVRCIWIVAVRANRRGTNTDPDGTNSNSDSNLRLSGAPGQSD